MINEFILTKGQEDQPYLTNKSRIIASCNVSFSVVVMKLYNGMSIAFCICYLLIVTSEILLFSIIKLSL